jgi:hypothetical protein
MSLRLVAAEDSGWHYNRVARARFLLLNILMGHIFLGYAKFQQMNDLFMIFVLSNNLGILLTQCFTSFRMANCS